jgi:hypothetical protein
MLTVFDTKVGGEPRTQQALDSPGSAASRHVRAEA